MTFEQLEKSIKSNDLAPVYLLHGEESFFIDKATELFLTHVLNDTEKEFNLNIFYGQDADPRKIVSAAMQYPLMSERRLVLLKEAQQMKEKDLNALKSYIEKPSPSTVLVLQYKGKKYPAKKGNLMAALKKNAVIFESKKVYENKIPQWIISYGKNLGLEIDNYAAGLLTELIGNNLGTIFNELQKLKIAVGDKKNITVDDIKKYITLSREYNVFELNRALGLKNNRKVFEIIDTFSLNPNNYPMTLIASVLYNYFSKLIIIAENIKKGDKELASMAKVNPFFMREYKKALRFYSRSRLYEIMDIIKEYDLKSKGVESRSFSSIELIKEMAIKILS